MTARWLPWGADSVGVIRCSALQIRQNRFDLIGLAEQAGLRLGFDRE
jgi:hypothetical protein